MALGHGLRWREGAAQRRTGDERWRGAQDGGGAQCDGESVSTSGGEGERQRSGDRQSTERLYDRQGPLKFVNAGRSADLGTERRKDTGSKIPESIQPRS